MTLPTEIPGPYPTPRSNNFLEKLLSFRKHIIPAETALIVTHDYPDPDCLASAFGVAHLLHFWGVASSIITFGGFVGRAENRAMIRVLNIPSVPFALTEIKDYDRIIMVDSFPNKGNVLIAGRCAGECGHRSPPA